MERSKNENNLNIRDINNLIYLDLKCLYNTFSFYYDTHKSYDKYTQYLFINTLNYFEKYLKCLSF